MQHFFPLRGNIFTISNSPDVFCCPFGTVSSRVRHYYTRAFNSFEHLLGTKPRNGCAQFGAYASQVSHSTARPGFHCHTAPWGLPRSLPSPYKVTPFQNTLVKVWISLTNIGANPDNSIRAQLESPQIKSLRRKVSKTNWNPLASILHQQWHVFIVLLLQVVNIYWPMSVKHSETLIQYQNSYRNM